MKKHPISVIVPVYKNYAMFFDYLNINRPFLYGCEVIIANDYPLQKISADVKKIIPDAIIIDNKKNYGFAGNVNRAVMKAKRDYVLLLNSDVVLNNDLFLKSINHFKKNHKLFAVGFAQKESDGKIVGANIGYFNNGLINHMSSPISVIQSPKVNFWAEGGAAIFRKSLFVKLGMFDEMFNPFYWEDIDLSYRAWKSGYQILFDSNILVEHHHESTIGKYFNQTEISRTAFRNQLIFHWKNLTDKDLLIKHVIMLPKYFLLPGFVEALKKLPAILPVRKKTVKLFIKSDKDILEIFSIKK